VNQSVDWNLANLLVEMEIRSTRSSALRFAKSCFFQVVVLSSQGEVDPSDGPSEVAYDLRSFVDPATGRIELEPVIDRLLGVVLLKSKLIREDQEMIAEENEQDEMMEEEEKAGDTPAAARNDIEMLSYPLKERVAAAVHAQCAFI
jgi:hypothetical protein